MRIQLVASTARGIIPCTCGTYMYLCICGCFPKIGVPLLYIGVYIGVTLFWEITTYIYIYIYTYIFICLSTYLSIDPSIYIHLYVCDYADWVSGRVASALELTLDEIALWWFALLGNLHELQHKGLDVGLSY